MSGNEWCSLTFPTSESGTGEREKKGHYAWVNSGEGDGNGCSPAGLPVGKGSLTATACYRGLILVSLT